MKKTLKKYSYIEMISSLSEEIGISKEETKEMVDSILSTSNFRKINYEELKDEIVTFLVINIFFIICKL
tara:strand:- start:335 stop:541 length:207 start_codon:yes stop_codon:yes gene_type:complete